MPLFLKVLLLIFLVLAPARAQRAPEVEAKLGSSFVVVGEKTTFSLLLRNVNVIGWPETPEKTPLAITRYRAGQYVLNNRLHDAYHFQVSAFQPGVFTIPAFEIQTKNRVFRTSPQTLHVFPVEQLTTQGLKVENKVVPYLTGVFLEKNTSFLGEAQSTEAKLYLSRGSPHYLQLHSSQVINMEKDGIAAWRFTTEPEPTGTLDYDGHQFAVYTYKSSINPLREGSLELGPGKAEATFSYRASLRGGFGTARHDDVLRFPAAPLEVRPLPSDAPEGFQGAVGDFTLEIDAVPREIQLGDTLTVETRVLGEGNIDQFPGPTLIDPDGDWKLFDMIAKPPGSERRSSSGTVEFSQVIRPTKKVSALPSFRFVFFDPVLEQYRTLETPSQPISVTGQLASAETGDQDLSFLTPGGQALLSFEPKSPFPIWLWQLLPAALVVSLFTIILKNRLASRRLQHQPAHQFKNTLAGLRELSNDRVAFYREASRIATEARSHTDFSEIFETRDEICFLPNHDPEPVPEAEKNRILNLLKSISPLLLATLFLGFFATPLPALPDEPAAAKAEILAEMKANPAREHFHNLALCELELGHPGPAALWAYRFEAQGGDASSILAELPGVRPLDRTGMAWISLLPRSLYLQVTFAGAWALLVLVITLKIPPTKLRRLLLRTSSIVATTALPLGFACWKIYPDEISFEPLHTLSVITQDAPLRSQAFEGGDIMRESLAGSLCKVTATRAGWSSLTLPGGLSGWIEEQAVEAIAEK